MKNILKVSSITYFFILTSFLCGYIKKTIFIFIIVMIHELGHVIISLLLGYKIISVEIYPFGGITKIDKLLNESIKKDLLISIAGILFQLPLFIIVKNPEFLYLNKMILLFNLFPIIPLDGSKIVFEIYNIFLSYEKSIKLYIATSLIFTLIYAYINYQTLLNNYLIIVLFLTKTYEIWKNKKIICKKFILEKLLYDLKYSSVDMNKSISDYKKDTRYYYFDNNKIINDQEYLKKIYFK